MVKVGTGFAFKASSLKEGCFRAQYNSVKDRYTLTGQVNNEITGWKNCTNKCQNIQYKVENDWKMVYLARSEGSDSAYIEWYFLKIHLASFLSTSTLFGFV